MRSPIEDRHAAAAHNGGHDQEAAADGEQPREDASDQADRHQAGAAIAGVMLTDRSPSFSVNLRRPNAFAGAHRH